MSLAIKWGRQDIKESAKTFIPFEIFSALVILINIDLRHPLSLYCEHVQLLLRSFVFKFQCVITFLQNNDRHDCWPNQVGGYLHCGTVWPTGCQYHATEDICYQKPPLNVAKYTLTGPPWENVSTQPEKWPLWFHYTVQASISTQVSLLKN